MKLEKNYLSLTSYPEHGRWSGYVLLKLFGVYDVAISFCRPQFNYYHCWYDGQQHSLFMGVVWIGWSGNPYTDCMH